MEVLEMDAWEITAWGVHDELEDEERRAREAQLRNQRRFE